AIGYSARVSPQSALGLGVVRIPAQAGCRGEAEPRPHSPRSARETLSGISSPHPEHRWSASARWEPKRHRTSRQYLPHQMFRRRDDYLELGKDWGCATEMSEL